MAKDPWYCHHCNERQEEHCHSTAINTFIQTIRSETEDNEDSKCPGCDSEVGPDDFGICCDRCEKWFHSVCIGMSDKEYTSLTSQDEDWFCIDCKVIRANKIKWGNLHGEDDIRTACKKIYIEITTWKKNIFLLPRGKAGTEFLKELTRLIDLFVSDSKWKNLSLTMMHIFIPIMLQKPSPKSKAKQHVMYLTKRLELWKSGDLNALMNEVRVIQKGLKTAERNQKESNEKAFCRLMLLGKVGQALKFIDNDTDIKGVHRLNRRVKAALAEKHPIGIDAPDDAKLEVTTQEPEAVIFESICAESVQSVAKTVNGSGGPTHIDADGWRHMLCCKSYGKYSTQLCETIAEFAKTIATQDVPSECLKEFTACRLVPLDKGDDKSGNIGVRPVGIGEVFRRIVGKLVVDVVKDDIQEALGSIQTCGGLKSGIEASIHSIKDIWEEEATEAVLLVDADNAFNRLNRRLAIHNIRENCPSFHRYIKNTYQEAATLVVQDSDSTQYLVSDEGCTQGDVAAMGFYGLGIQPLTKHLSATVNQSACKQSWYADDSTAVGRLAEIRRWWDELASTGPKYGYYPKPSKTVLIIKDPTLMTEAMRIFDGTGIKLSTEGERHLGAVLGSDEYRLSYVKTKISKWIKDVQQLSEIGKEEPQLALSGYTKGLCQRWTFLQRTVPGIAELFEPLEKVIAHTFIPAIVGREISELQRDMLALPVRYGGLGLANPVKTADREYETSRLVTANLTELIKHQDISLDNYNRKEVKACITKLKEQKEDNFKERLVAILSQLETTDKRSARALQLSQEKGCGAWLTALPLASLGYVLNKQEFRDSLNLRYGWKIGDIPNFCVCGEKNSIDHTLICKTGGHVIFRHNRIRDVNASFLRQVCHNVVIEPELLPIESANFQSVHGNQADRARLDISANGLWGPFQKTMFDVRIFHPYAKTYENHKLSDIYARHEKEKQRNYLQRVLQIEKASFTPLVYSTHGGMANEAKRFHKKVALMIADKTRESYSDVLNCMRTKLTFAMLRSVLISVRGSRGRTRKVPETPISCLSYNLIPEIQQYETS